MNDDVKIIQALTNQNERMRAALEAWEAFWNDMPNGQLGKIVCNIGLLNEAFCKTTEALGRKEKKK